MPRGITPITLLAEHGVAVSAGGDNVQDPFNPMGRFDPLETAALLVMAAHMTPMDAFAAVSSEPQWLGNPLRDLIGLPANFLVVDAANVRDAVASAPSTRRTVRGGRVVASSTVERMLTMSRPDRTN
jgi:cytosine deaminase